MDFLDINNQINATKHTDSIFGHQKPDGARTNYAEPKIPEIKDSFEKKKTAENDGKFSFLEFGKNIVKGAGQFFVDIYKNIVENPIISLGILALGAAVASTPLGFALLAGGGLMFSLGSVIFIGCRSAYFAADDKWDKLEKEGKEIGKLIPATIISAIGAVKASKMLSQATTGSAATSEKLSVSLKKSMNYFNQASASVLKNVVLFPYRIGKSIINDPKKFFNEDIKHIHKFFTGGINKDYSNLGKDYVNAVRNLNGNLFSAAEKQYMLTVLSKTNPDRARFFDWKCQGLLDINSIPTIIKQAGD